MGSGVGDGVALALACPPNKPARAGAGEKARAPQNAATTDAAITIRFKINMSLRLMGPNEQRAPQGDRYA
jgi:hypothetical protein